MRRTWLLTAAFCMLILAACSAQGPSATPAGPTALPSPAASRTAEPTIDPLQALVPHGTPAAAWGRIPIPPGAIAGTGDALGYVFTTEDSPEEIGKFYQEVLPALGWTYQSTSEPDAEGHLMVFTGSEGTLTVSVYEHEGQRMVLLVR